MKKWEQDILYLSDYKDDQERSLRRKDVFSFYFMLAEMARRNNNKPGELTGDFGMK